VKSHLLCGIDDSAIQVDIVQQEADGFVPPKSLDQHGPNGRFEERNTGGARIKVEPSGGLEEGNPLLDLEEGGLPIPLARKAHPADR
jgi:hypothetical protein